MRIFSVVLLVAMFQWQTKALTCWFCHNKKSLRECAQQGRVEKCLHNQDACEFELRMEHGVRNVNKRCKQAHACGNNYMQNHQPAWNGPQCNIRRVLFVCRCCCATDNCNYGTKCRETPNAPDDTFTLNKVTCEPLAVPSNGTKTCDIEETEFGNALRTKCTFGCNKGYKLVGQEVSTCELRDEYAAFDNPSPFCTSNPMCRPLPVPEHGSKTCTYDDTNGVPVGTVCTFTCEKNYLLRGIPTSTCERVSSASIVGRFTNTHPIRMCRPNPRCDPVGVPEFGRVLGCTRYVLGGTAPGSICTFACRKGYKLVGHRATTCRVGEVPTEADYDNLVPTCRPNPQCDIIAAPRFGSISCGETGRIVDVGTECSFSCNEGYELIGEFGTTCVRGETPLDAHWDHPTPTCKPNPKCDILRTPRYGSKECTQMDSKVDPGTECSFSCDIGFLVVGKLHSTCVVGSRSNIAEFTYPAPTCRPNPKCQLLGELENGRTTCSQGGAEVDPGTLCTFECDEGYVRIGSRRSLCVQGEAPNEAEFNYPLPFCRPNPRCDIIGSPEHGSKDCSETGVRVRPGTICKFKCNNGYRLIGDERSTCRDGETPLDAAFDNEVPTCELIPKCIMMDDLQFGNMECSQIGEKVDTGTICSFLCNEGYNLDGPQSSTCLESETAEGGAAFNNPTPTCIPEPKCDIIPAPEFGSKLCTQEGDRVDPGAECKFSCNPGYLLVGHRASTCVQVGDTPEANFDRPVPFCLPNPKCSSLEAPDQGTITCTQDDDSVDPGTVCRFTCNNGYILEGSRRSTCIRASNPLDSAFDNSVPTCTPNPKCDLIETPQFGRKTCTQETLRVDPGTVCQFICDRGYILQGAIRSTCRAAADPLDSAFDEPVPTCRPNPMCDSIRGLEFGSVRCDQRGRRVEPGTICTFQCNEGYILEGSGQSTCRAAVNPLNSAFDNPLPTCKPSPMCDLIGDPQFGTKRCSQNDPRVDPGTVCQFECNAGYILRGFQRSTCRAAVKPLDSAFDNAIPTCEPNPKCDSIGSPLFGSKRCTQDGPVVDPGTRCFFECTEGYILQGAGVSTCIAALNPINSAFDNPVPICSRNPMCDLIGNPEFGSKSCTQESPQVDPGTVCRFQCVEGYLLNGSNRSTCLEAANPINSAFDNPVPNCRPNPMCDIIESPQFGSKRCTQDGIRVDPGTVCRFRCNAGYRLQGPRQSTCRAASNPLDSAFDNRVPICQRNPKCDLIGAPGFGTKRCTQNDPKVDPGTVCRFACNAGYILQGSTISTCREAANPLDSAFDNLIPICIPNPVCDLIRTPRFGSRVCTQERPQVDPGTVCSFQCNEGYLLEGESQSTCIGATNPIESAFNNSPPRCIRNPKCEAIAAPDHGYKSCTQDSALVDPGTFCTFTCDEGYQLRGAIQSTCVEASNPKESSFDNPAPTCERNPKCDIIDTPVNGFKSCTQEGDLVDPGTVCSFTCEPSYLLQGSQQSTCIEHEDPTKSAFDNLTPTCTPNPMCDIIGTPENGEKSCTENGAQVNPGAVCSFTCNDGFILTGDTSSTCRMGARPTTAEFDNKVPFCRRELCNELEPVPNGNIRCTDGNQLNSVCNFSCRKGFNLFPSNRTETVCSPNTATWSVENPCCVAICPAFNMDLSIILDSSGSIGEDNWALLKRFMRRFINNLDVRRNATQVAIATYSTVVTPEAKLPLTFNKRRIQTALRDFQWIAEETNTGKALKYVRTRVFGTSSDRDDAVNVVLLVTDGNASDKVMAPARSLRRSGATVFALGIQPGDDFSIDPAELEKIAGDKDHVIFVEGGFESLGDTISEQLRIKLCGEPKCT